MKLRCLLGLHSWSRSIYAVPVDIDYPRPSHGSIMLRKCHDCDLVKWTGSGLVAGSRE